MNQRLLRQLPRGFHCGRRVRPGEVVAFGDGGVSDDVCPSRAAFQLTDTLLSETGEALLSFLRSIPDSMTCEDCVASYLQADRATALKAIRELILNGHILCKQATCSMCREGRLVAYIEWEPPRLDGGFKPPRNL